MVVTSHMSQVSLHQPLIRHATRRSCDLVALVVAGVFTLSSPLIRHATRRGCAPVALAVTRGFAPSSPPVRKRQFLVVTLLLLRSHVSKCHSVLSFVARHVLFLCCPGRSQLSGTILFYHSSRNVSWCNLSCVPACCPCGHSRPTCFNVSRAVPCSSYPDGYQCCVFTYL